MISKDITTGEDSMSYTKKMTDREVVASAKEIQQRERTYWEIQDHEERRRVNEEYREWREERYPTDNDHS